MLGQRKLVATAIFAVVSALNGYGITIDFESFADTQNLNGVNLGGVTLTAPGGVVEVFDNRFGVGSNSGTKAVANLNGANQDNPLVGVFDTATSFVSLFGGDGGNDTESWTLNVFDAQIGGNLLGSVSTASFNGNPYRELQIFSAGILRFEAVHNNSPYGMGFDDLSFDTSQSVPDNGMTISLLGLALVGLAAIRRKFV